jgi:hypothetical protein
MTYALCEGLHAFRISRHDWFSYMKLFFVSYSLRPKKWLFVWGSFLRGILNEAKEKVAYRDLLIIKVRIRDINCQSLCLRYLYGLFLHLLQSMSDTMMCVKKVFFWKVFGNLTSADNNTASSPAALFPYNKHVNTSHWISALEDK